MNRFNLTFNGEIVEGQDRELVKLRFANLFAIDDPARLERFFSGETVILQHNLERKAAAQLFHELQLLGAVAALVTVTSDDEAATITPQPPVKKSVAGNKTRQSATGPKTAPSAIDAKSAAFAASPSPNDRVDIAAEIKARKLAAQRLASEQAAKEKAAREAQQREIADAAAREQALAAEQARQAAKEAARKAAEQVLRKQLEAEEIARKNALKAAAKRKAAEEAAQRKAKRAREKAEKARLKEAEAAKRQAEVEEKKRVAAEEAAKRQAEAEEKKRAAAEEAAKRQAEAEKRERVAAEEAARRKTEAEEKKRVAALEAARHKAEIAARKRLAAEQEAQRKTALEAEKRRAAAEVAQRAAAQAAESARRKAELAAMHSAQEAALSLTTAAQATTVPLRIPTAKRVKPRVKTALEVPLRTPGETPQIGNPGPRKRQSGEPNLYKLQPFRNSAAVRARALQAAQQMRKSYMLGIIALGVLLIIVGSYLRYADNAAITGAAAMAINSKSEPVLLAGKSLLLHDRAGVSTTTTSLDALDASALEPPLVFDSTDSLIARGRLRSPDTESAATEHLQLLRCKLSSTCALFSPQLNDVSVDAFVVNPVDDSLLLADRDAGHLLKVSRDGAIVASAEVPIPPEPVLRLHGGLLWLNSSTAPAISVFRYEDDAFGRQLDEILLLPTTEVSLEEARVHDFIWSGDAWWVNLRSPANDSGELHRFDEEWNYLDTIALASAEGPLQLVTWGQKTLVNNPRTPAIERYNAAGDREAPFASSQLRALVGDTQQRSSLVESLWRGSMLACAIAALLGIGFGYWHGLRSLVYRPRREQGAESVDSYTDMLQWMEPVQTRQAQFRRTGIYYGLGVCAVLMLAIALNFSAQHMAALLIACCGPAIALLLLSRQPVGSIGVLGDRLLLVDHSGLYHLAGGARLQYHGPFLAIDDIVVFAGSRWLPAFSQARLQRHIRPVAMGAVKVDRKTIAVKLLEGRHPLSLGVIAIIAAVAAAILLLILPSVF